MTIFKKAIQHSMANSHGRTQNYRNVLNGHFVESFTLNNMPHVNKNPIQKGAISFW